MTEGNVRSTKTKSLKVKKFKATIPRIKKHFSFYFKILFSMLYSFELLSKIINTEYLLKLFVDILFCQLKIFPKNLLKKVLKVLKIVKHNIAYSFILS